MQKKGGKPEKNRGHQNEKKKQKEGCRGGAAKLNKRGVENMYTVALRAETEQPAS